MNYYWLTEHSNKSITPLTEDFDPVELLKIMRLKRTLDFGCGFGRLSPAFSPSDYLGLDMSASRINSARKLYPNYSFTVLAGSKYFDTLLFYTVAVHLTDEEFIEVIDRFPNDRIIIIEVIGRKYRRNEGEPAVYNREIDEYSTMLKGYNLHAKLEGLRYKEKPYHHLTVLDFRANYSNLFSRAKDE